MFLRLVASRFDHGDAGFDDRLPVFCVGGGLMAGRIEVHAERLIRHASRARDFLQQSVGRRLRQRRQEAEGACVGDGRTARRDRPCMPPWATGCWTPESSSESCADRRKPIQGAGEARGSFGNAATPSRWSAVRPASRWFLRSVAIASSNDASAADQAMRRIMARDCVGPAANAFARSSASA